MCRKKISIVAAGSQFAVPNQAVSLLSTSGVSVRCDLENMIFCVVSFDIETIQGKC